MTKCRWSLLGFVDGFAIGDRCTYSCSCSIIWWRIRTTSCKFISIYLVSTGRRGSNKARRGAARRGTAQLGSARPSLVRPGPAQAQLREAGLGSAHGHSGHGPQAARAHLGPHLWSKTARTATAMCTVPGDSLRGRLDLDKLAPSTASNCITSLSLCCACGARWREPPLGGCFLETFSGGCLGSNNGEGRRELW